MKNIEKLRLSTTSSLTFRKKRCNCNVASVSCLYGIGNPVEFKKNIIQDRKKPEIISTNKVSYINLVQSLYSRSHVQILVSGCFRVSGDIVDVFPSYADQAFKIHFFW